ncbi:zinc finger and BTB domain-containing protein 14-like isoform X2 [Aphidius gifuensis]|uniref:zinc finger and BTB domain-containing protein 14-like isoform X2 n=1 Tax=Aphidius gifuensis TaxID=684658 RepID=UPI001CDD1A95|nr:zinc finger and BTB domain-containing protein 14-like isoform X2 [Aphidius gifuensis]
MKNISKMTEKMEEGEVMVIDELEIKEMTDSQQQFCLRWNNFQANITSQFEALRDDEDFVDVTFACDGRRLQAHKVVLSACSPYFKELFKTNPCKHPIIFMRDVEFEHLQSLLEFMYAGEVNISQAELSIFLRTAESLQIRGLTDSQNNQQNNEKNVKTNNIHPPNGRGLSPTFDDERSKSPPASSSPPPLKRLCKKSDSPKNSSPVPVTVPSTTNTPRNRLVTEPQVQLDYKDVDIVEPKVELPEYGSDEDYSPKQELNPIARGFLSLDGGSAVEGGIPGPSHGNTEPSQEQADLRKLHSLDPRPCLVCNRMYSNLSNLRQHMRLIHNPQSVTCPICSKSFKTKLYLKRHLVSFHDVNPADRQLQEEIYQHQIKVQTGSSLTTTTTSSSSTTINNTLCSTTITSIGTSQNNLSSSSPSSSSTTPSSNIQNGLDTLLTTDTTTSTTTNLLNTNLIDTNNCIVINNSSPSPSLQLQNQSSPESDTSNDDKLRAYHAHIGDNSYPVEVVQLPESKNFGNMVQFNATF